LFEGQAKKVLPASCPGTKSRDNTEIMQTPDDFMHLKYLVLENSNADLTFPGESRSL